MTITTDQLTQFRALLKNEEKSAATPVSYTHLRAHET